VCASNKLVYKPKHGLYFELNPIHGCAYRSRVFNYMVEFAQFFAANKVAQQ